MGSTYHGAQCTITIESTVVPGKLKHFATAIGATPSEFVVLWLGKRPKDINADSYLGKPCTLQIATWNDGASAYNAPVLACTGTVQDVDKFDGDTGYGVEFTVVDYRHKINAGYIGQNFLETLDTSSPASTTWGVATTFTNGLPWYGADIIFNLNGLPNQSLTALGFVPPGYAHSTAYARYWTFGSILEWIWTYCILPTTGIAVPMVAGRLPSLWTFGGMDLKSPQLGNFLGMPMAQAIDAVLKETRVQWCVDANGDPQFFAIDKYTATETWTERDPDAPVAPTADDLTTPFGVHVKKSVMDAVGQLDIIGGKEQREVMIGPAETTRKPWFGIDIAGGWTNALTFIGNPYDIKWTNYQVERYIQTYINSYGSRLTAPTEQEWRYDLNYNIFEAHKLGANLPIGPDASTSDFQPYKMLGQLLLARDKAGNYCNPDLATAYQAVSPMEVLKLQYPDGCSLDLDRDYLLARGIWGSWYTNGLILLPPIYGVNNPFHFTVAFECAYRAYVSKVVPVTPGAAYQIRRAIMRDELIHKTCEATQVIAPVVIEWDAIGNWTIIEGIALPPGWTRNYALTGSAYIAPFDTTTLTWTRPAGTVVDGMSELKEVADLVAPFVGIPMVTGQAYYPAYKPLALGTNVLDPSSVWGLTGKEIVVAVVFDDESQRTEFQFVNRMGIDVTQIASEYVDQRRYQRAI